MNKVFLETSFFIKYLTADNETKFQDCVRLLELVEAGRIRPYTSNIVIFEVLFVLTRLYGFTKEESLDSVKKILDIRNLTLLENTNTKRAIKIFEQNNVKFPDCLITTQIPSGVKLVTYDTDFSKINSALTATPADFL